MRTTFFIIITIGFLSCRNEKKLLAYVSSNNEDSLVMGFNKLKIKDTDYVKYAFVNEYDQRETFLLSYQTQTVYQAKMNAMKRISGLNPPREITRKVDTLIINFYKQWAISKGYITGE